MKPRSDSVLFSLSLEDQEKLNTWLLNNHSYAEVQRFLSAEAPEGMGIHVHQTSLRRYYDRVMPGYIAERRKSVLATARHLKTVIADDPGDFDAPILDALKQRVFELTLAPDSNSDTIYKLYRLLLRSKDQELARERFEFNAAKAIMQNFDEIAQIMKKRTPQTLRETLDLICKEVFGIHTEIKQPLTGADSTNPPMEPTPTPESEPESWKSPTPAANPPNQAQTVSDLDPESTELNAVYPTDPPEGSNESTIGGASIVPAVAPPFELPPLEKLPDAPEVFEADPSRNYRVINGVDCYGMFLHFEYLDGNNPHRNTKYFLDPRTGQALRRPQQ